MVVGYGGEVIVGGGHTTVESKRGCKNSGLSVARSAQKNTAKPPPRQLPCRPQLPSLVETSFVIHLQLAYPRSQPCRQSANGIRQHLQTQKHPQKSPKQTKEKQHPRLLQPQPPLLLK